MTGVRVVRLAGTRGRTVEVTLYEPREPVADPVAVVFSHGANAAPSRYAALLKTWTDAGMIVCAPMHVDSEDHRARIVDDPLQVRRSRMEDVGLVVATLREGGFGFAPIERYVAAGHSYGALVAQVAGGAMLESAAGVRGIAAPAPCCVVALSPPPSIPGLMTDEGWSHGAVPTLCVTGTADAMPGFVDDWRRHLDSFAATPRSFAAIFAGMDHYFGGAFGRLAPGDAGRDAAVAELNAAIIAFIAAWTDGSGMTGPRWIAGAGPRHERHHVRHALDF